MNSHQKQQEEDRILLAHVRDLSGRSAWRSFTGFLDRRQYTMLKMHLSQGCYCFSGGYPEAERGILCLHPQDCPPADSEFPFVCLTIRFRKEDKLTHRDVLGSFMSQQIQRDRIGDILVSSGKIQCFVMEQIAPVLLSIRKIGRIGVQITDQEAFSGTYPQEMQEISGVVSSPRLDAILKTALRLRRQECAGLILAGKVMCNYQEVTKPDLVLQAGDVFSVRGYGKFRLDAVSAPTQKNRLHILIRKYL